MATTPFHISAAVQILDSVEITLVKSIIEIRYPLVYERQFNAGPFETTLYASASGRAYSATNPCVDTSSSSSACAWSVDAAGNRVPYSNVRWHPNKVYCCSTGACLLHLQGFCCSCALSLLPTRSQLTCNALGNVGGSAHCLTFGPLWYSVSTESQCRTSFRHVAYDHCSGLFFWPCDCHFFHQRTIRAMPFGTK